MAADPRPRTGLASPSRWPARLRAAARTVRGRASAAAVLVVALALTITAVALVGELDTLMTDDVGKANRLRALEASTEVVESVADTGQIPGVLDVSDPDDEFEQVLDPAGVVLRASANVAGLPAQGGANEHERVITGPLPEKPSVVLSSQTVDTARGRLTVLIGHSLDAVADTTETVALLLVIGLPLLLPVVGVTTWLLTGRALAPVEAIRAEVDAISSARLDRRVSEPPGEDEIARLARTMNGMLARLERSAARQRGFVADASHELRSPVAAIRQHAEVSLADPDRYPGPQLARTVLVEALRVQRLIEDLLLLARADESSLDARREPVDLDDLVFEEAARLRGSTTPGGGPLRVDTAAVSAGRVDGNADALRRLLRNLVDNAARHAVEQVSLELAEHDDRVLLAVEDDGPGIPSAERERVLERFVRLDVARTRDDGGSGLGLAIVAELARAHHAELRIGVGALGGARVEVSFPPSAG
ncbi:MAG TPA: HAMP domain-containing sensor histidine kinase [Pseudonocardia sp.]|nr:HAMP domain-containing sensor histidine kinase [Pseudonocardia sp.]